MVGLETCLPGSLSRGSSNVREEFALPQVAVGSRECLPLPFSGLAEERLDHEEKSLSENEEKQYLGSSGDPPRMSESPDSTATVHALGMGILDGHFAVARVRPLPREVLGVALPACTLQARDAPDF